VETNVRIGICALLGFFLAVIGSYSDFSDTSLVVIGSILFFGFIVTVIFFITGGATKSKEEKIESAKRFEKILDFDEAARIYDRLGMDDDLIRVRTLQAESGSVKVAQKVIQGDEVTEIKDSVLNRSNINSEAKSKAEEIKEIKELLDSGAIDEDEFKQMKKEILGK